MHVLKHRQAPAQANPPTHVCAFTHLTSLNLRRSCDQLARTGDKTEAESLKDGNGQLCVRGQVAAQRDLRLPRRRAGARHTLAIDLGKRHYKELPPAHSRQKRMGVVGDTGRRAGHAMSV
eukprot:6191835-Pleurochrysis_carterae.AAC.1